MSVLTRISSSPATSSLLRRSPSLLRSSQRTLFATTRWNVPPLLPGGQDPVVIPTDSSAPSTFSTIKSNPSKPSRLEPEHGSLAGPVPAPPKPSAEPRRAPVIKSSKAAITLTPEAVTRLRNLLNGPTPQLVRIGVRNKGCAGMSYHLEFVDKPGRFDEVVEQDGVKVLIDSKALFSIIGSEMDWVEDRMSAKFAFKNPNVVDACGCGDSFNIAP